MGVGILKLFYVFYVIMLLGAKIFSVEEFLKNEMKEGKEKFVEFI